MNGKIWIIHPVLAFLWLSSAYMSTNRDRELNFQASGASYSAFKGTPITTIRTLPGISCRPCSWIPQCYAGYSRSHQAIQVFALRGGGDEDRHISTNPFSRILGSIKKMVASSVQKCTSILTHKFSGKIDDFRSCTVTQANFDAVCEEIEGLLPSCSFYSLDCEMTSLNPSDGHPQLQASCDSNDEFPSRGFSSAWPRIAPPDTKAPRENSPARRSRPPDPPCGPGAAAQRRPGGGCRPAGPLR